MSLIKHIAILKREKEFLENGISILEEKGRADIISYRKEFIGSLNYAINKLTKLLNSNQRKEK